MFEYIAGIIDGEGTITDKSMKISNTHLGMLLTIQAFAGGRIIKSKSEANKLGRKECFVLYFRVDEMNKLLPKIIPYLIIKKASAVRLLKKIYGKFSAPKRNKLKESFYYELFLDKYIEDDEDYY